MDEKKKNAVKAAREGLLKFLSDYKVGDPEVDAAVISSMLGLLFLSIDKEDIFAEIVDKGAGIAVFAKDEYMKTHGQEPPIELMLKAVIAAMRDVLDGNEVVDKFMEILNGKNDNNGD